MPLVAGFFPPIVLFFFPLLCALPKTSSPSRQLPFLLKGLLFVALASFPPYSKMSRTATVLRPALLRPWSSQLRSTSGLYSRTLLAYKPVRGLANPATMPAASKENIGVYCNPEHKLWVEGSGPSVEDVKTGQSLKEGEVTIAIKSTGICGCVFLPFR